MPVSPKQEGRVLLYYIIRVKELNSKWIRESSRVLTEDDL